MNSPGEIEKHILRKLLVKERLIMDDIQMVVDEFPLDRSVIARSMMLLILGHRG